MTVEPFVPKREDGRAAWQVIYDYVIDEIQSGRLKTGDLIRHEVLAAQLDCELDSGYYSAVSRAAIELQRKHGRSLQSTRRVGYQLIAGMGQYKQSQHQVDRSRRQFRRGLRTIETVDAGAIELASDRHLVDQVRRGMLMIAAVLQQHMEKIGEHDRVIQELQNSRLDDRARVRVTETELDDLRRRISELEATRDNPATSERG